MRSILVLGLLLVTTPTASAEIFTSTPTVLRTKTIYARADGTVSKVSLVPGQVFLWDEFAAGVEPSRNVRPEFGRAYTDFAGAVSRVLVEEGQSVSKGDPLYECKFLERVYTTCVVPNERVDVQRIIDQPVRVTWQGEVFEGKVIDAVADHSTTQLQVMIYNHHEHRYWHLTGGQVVQIELECGT
jgi:hypothetical protein